METKARCKFLAATVIAAATLLTMAASTHAAVLINEFWVDDAYNITAQYIELYNTSASSASLNGLSLVVVNGDTSGDPNSTLYGQVDLRVDFGASDSIGANGYYLIGSGLVPNPNKVFQLGYIGQGTITIALVNTADIAYKDPPTNRHLTDASILAITSNKLDAVGTRNSGTDDIYFGATDLGGVDATHSWDTASRLPDGGSWNGKQDNYTNALELGDPNNLLGTPGKANGWTNNGYPRTIWGACCTTGGSCSYVQQSACTSPSTFQAWRDCDYYYNTRLDPNDPNTTNPDSACSGPPCYTIAQAKDLRWGTPVKLCNVIVSYTVDTIYSANSKTIAVQDFSGAADPNDPNAARGILVYGSNAQVDAVMAATALGHKIDLQGTLRPSMSSGTNAVPTGVLELQDDTQAALTVKADYGNVGVPALVPATTGNFTDNNARAEQLESVRVKINCVAFVDPTQTGGFFAGGTSYLITDGTNQATLRTVGDIGVTDPNHIVNGNPIPKGVFGLTALVSQYDTSSPYTRYYQLDVVEPTDVDPNSPGCAAAVGACCLPDGSCAILTQALCLNLRYGTYSGNGTTCPPTPPCQPIADGACWNRATQTCTLTSHTGCDNLGGGWAGAGVPCSALITVAQARTMLGQAVILRDVMMGVPKDPCDPGNLVSLNNTSSVVSYFIQDNSGTAGAPVGLNIFGSATTDKPKFAGLDAGSHIMLKGTLAASDYNGLREISSGIDVTYRYGATGPLTPTIVTCADFADGSATAEALESTLVTLKCVTFVETGFFAGSTNYHVTDGTNTALLRISATTQYTIVGQPIPTKARDITGIFSQYDTTSPYDGGYQLQPRVWADFVPAACACQTCGGDFDGSGQVNAGDLAYLGAFVNAMLGIGGTPNPCMDVNGDGKYDGKDVQMFITRVLSSYDCVQPPAGTVKVSRCDIPTDTCPFASNTYCRYYVTDDATTQAMLIGLDSCVADGKIPVDDGACLVCPGTCPANNAQGGTDYQIFRWKDGVSVGHDCYFVGTRVSPGTCYSWNSGSCQERFVTVP